MTTLTTDEHSYNGDTPDGWGWDPHAVNVFHYRRHNVALVTVERVEPSSSEAQPDQAWRVSTIDGQRESTHPTATGAFRAAIGQARRLDDTSETSTAREPYSGTRTVVERGAW